VVTLAFKKGTGLQAWFIRFWTWSRYSHVEIIIKDKWISANPKDGIDIHDLRPLQDDWMYIPIAVDESKYGDVFDFLEQQKDHRYDWCGIFCSQFFGIRKENPDRWFCSELVTRVLQIFEVEDVIFREACTLSPGDLYNIFK